MKRILPYIAALLFVLCSCVQKDVVLELVDDDPDALIYTDEGQTARLKLTSSHSWKASCSAEWIELLTPKGSAGDEQTFKFTLSPNKEAKTRTAEITLSAGGQTLVLTVKQQPVIVYYVNENFDSDNLIYENELPARWVTIDADGDHFGWRCYRDPETNQTFAYSASYYTGVLIPDNWMLTPRFKFPESEVSVRWDSLGYDPEYPGDKYEVWVAMYKDGEDLQLLEKICTETVESTTELTHHKVSIEKFDDITICIAFHHFDFLILD